MRDYEVAKKAATKPQQPQRMDENLGLARAQTLVQPPGAAGELLRLQRRNGNRYVQHVIDLSRQGKGEACERPEIKQPVQAARRYGQPLDSGVHAEMEPALGAEARSNNSGMQLQVESKEEVEMQPIRANASRGPDMLRLARGPDGEAVHQPSLGAGVSSELKEFEKFAEEDRRKGVTIKLPDPINPSKYREVAPGTDVGGGIVVLVRIGGYIFYKYRNRLVRMEPAEFERQIQVGVIGQEGTKWIAPHVRKFEYLGLFAMLTVRPDLTYDVLEQMMAGKDPLSPESGRKYVASAIMGPLSKVTKTLKIPGIDALTKVLTEAAKSIIRQLLSDQQLKTSKVTEDALKGLIADRIGKLVVGKAAPGKDELRHLNMELGKRGYKTLSREKLKGVLENLVEKELKAFYEVAKVTSSGRL